MPTTLDHIILLLSPHDFENVPSWLSDNFNIIDGGTHSKGTSHNKLIIFKDGTYLELFSWVDPQPDGVPLYADFPSWANKPEGNIIDWALTGDDAQTNYDGIMQRLQRLREEHQLNIDRIDMTYDKPVSGGRKRKDGKELQWVTTRPRLLLQQSGTANAHLDVPFFCHDVTARNLRVPFDDEAVTTHPCGARGVGRITFRVPKARYEQYIMLYLAILGQDKKEVTSSFAEECPTSYERGTLFNFLPPARGIREHTHVAVYARCETAKESPQEPLCGDSELGFQELVLWTDKHKRRGQRLGGNTNGLGNFLRLE